MKKHAAAAAAAAAAAPRAMYRYMAVARQPAVPASSSSSTSPARNAELPFCEQHGAGRSCLPTYLSMQAYAGSSFSYLHGIPFHSSSTAACDPLCMRACARVRVHVRACGPGAGERAAKGPTPWGSTAQVGLPFAWLLVALQASRYFKRYLPRWVGVLQCPMAHHGGGYCA